jgi:hypothetical protein
LVGATASSFTLACKTTNSAAQDQSFRFRVFQAEQSVIGGMAADVQEQGLVDSELLREQIRPSLGLTQPTGADGPVEPLARLVCRHREQFVKAMFLQ